MLGQLTVINYNGLGIFWLTPSIGDIVFISVFVVATIMRFVAVAWAVLGLKGFIYIMTPSVFTISAMIRGLSAIATFGYDYV